MTPPRVTLEEHWYSTAVLNSFDNSMKEGIKQWPGVLGRLLDAVELRLREMDKCKVALQVISHCAADNPSPEVCRAGNDQLANEVRKTEEAFKRLAAFAVLPMAHPAAAAAELERTVKEHGFLGALVDHKSKKGYCDGVEYDDLWRKAQELDVPIYLHLSRLEDEIFRQAYAGNYSDRATSVIGGAMWEWHSEVGIHICRLHAAGILDKSPKLKIIIGHFGEMMPFMLQRIIDQEVIMGQRERPFRKVWDENIWITTSVFDYPFTTNEAGLKWFGELEKSGLVTGEELELIAYKNAENLLGIKAP